MSYAPSVLLGKSACTLPDALFGHLRTAFHMTSYAPSLHIGLAFIIIYARSLLFLAPISQCHNVCFFHSLREICVYHAISCHTLLCFSSPHTYIVCHRNTDPIFSASFSLYTPHCPCHLPLTCEENWGKAATCTCHASAPCALSPKAPFLADASAPQH